MHDLYINTNPVEVNMLDKDNNLVEKITLKFPTKWINGSTDNKGKDAKSLFSGKRNSSKYEEDIKIEGKTYNINHMNLLPYVTIEELKYMVASFLKTDYKNILKVYSLNDIEYVNKDDVDKCKNYNWTHMNERLVDIDAYNVSLSIGYKKLVIDVLYSDKKIINTYDYKFYDNYKEIITYINSILLNNENKLTKEEITEMACVQNIEVMLVYGSDNNTGINEINITKLFNILHINANLKKILIHDNALTDFNNEERETQYIKTMSNIDDPFKNTFSRYNCCSIYVVNEIFPGITLSRIEVYKDSLIKCCFIVNDPDIAIDVVKDVMTTYFGRDKGKFWKLFDKLHIDECIYNFDYSSSNFIPIYNNMSFIYTLDEVKASHFKNSFNIVNQEIPSMVYKTNTSSFMSVYSSFNIGTFYNYYYSRSFHNMVTNITIKADVLSHAHLQASDDSSVVCYISKCFSDDDLLMNSILLLPIFEISKQVKQSADDYDNLPPEEKLKIIKNKYQKIPTKKAIKKLIEVDPILFGNRKINEKDFRPYSALAQKKEQRVVSITKKEYDEIYKINPEFVANIKNQSQGNQRLYLFCPFDKFEYLNFHHYHNQLCIPKCTTAITKRSQYMYCNNQLGAKDVADSSESDVSKMIVYYSPLLLAGRRCKPPDELFMLCENYNLLKLDMGVNLMEYYLENAGLPPCILTRNNIEKMYIINTEIEPNQDYALCIQSELDNGYYYIYSELDGSPYKLSEHRELFNFIKSIQVNKNTGYEFFDFLATVLKITFSKEYDNKTFKQMIEELENVHKVQLITNLNKNKIVAVKHKDKLWFTPELPYDRNTLTGDYKNINITLPNSKFPKISQFNDFKAGPFYKDYKDNLVHVVKYMKTYIIVEPFDPGPTIPCIYFDYEAYYNMYLLSASAKIREQFIVKYRDQKLIKNILYTLIYIYYNTYDSNLESLKDILINMGIVIEGPTNINYIDEKINLVSWRKTKINNKEFEQIFDSIKDVDYKTLIYIVYIELYDSMNIYSLKDNECISNKIITNNTI